MIFAIWLGVPSPIGGKQKGVSIVELLLVISFTMVMFAFVLLYVDPIERRRIARDNVRLNDINILDRAITEYALDNGFFPDTDLVLRESTIAPSSETISLDNSTKGWIDANLSKYTSRLPVDPINDENYHYSYYHAQTSYELNAVLEHLSVYAEGDGGDDPSVYEMGNNLVLLSP